MLCLNIYQRQQFPISVWVFIEVKTSHVFWFGWKFGRFNQAPCAKLVEIIWNDWFLWVLYGEAAVAPNQWSGCGCLIFLYITIRKLRSACQILIYIEINCCSLRNNFYRGNFIKFKLIYIITVPRLEIYCIKSGICTSFWWVYFCLLLEWV